MQFPHRHVLGLADFSRDDILTVLDVADSFKEVSKRDIKKVPTLRGRTVINLFYEPSTRTRLSFEVAAKRMSADTFNISVATSSAKKGETLVDTARNLAAMNPDVLIVRHSASGTPHLLARHVAASVINAGDGTHEHPSQALLDLLTVREHKGRIEGLKVAIVGDIAHSRVAHSNIIGFTRMGAEVALFAPRTLLPMGVEQLGARVCSSLADAVRDADVVMTLRIQRERLKDPLLPSWREYAEFFGINHKVMALAKPDAILMHPGPVNRGVELDPLVADSGQSVILDQVTNGVAVRMALLYLIMAREDEA